MTLYQICYCQILQFIPFLKFCLYFAWLLLSKSEYMDIKYNFGRNESHPYAVSFSTGIPHEVWFPNQKKHPLTSLAVSSAVSLGSLGRADRLGGGLVCWDPRIKLFTLYTSLPTGLPALKFSSPGFFLVQQLLWDANCISSRPEELLLTAATKGPASIPNQ